MRFLFLITILVKLGERRVFSASCDWADETGFAEGYCSYSKWGDDQESAKFTCDGTVGTVSFWSNADCSGDADYNSTIDATEDNFQCGTGDNSCTIIKMTQSYYQGSTDCSVTPETDYETVYYVVDHIDCYAETETDDIGDSFELIVNTDGHFVFLYSDTNCQNLYYINNVTGQCADWQGNSTDISFRETNSGQLQVPINNVGKLLMGAQVLYLLVQLMHMWLFS